MPTAKVYNPVHWDDPASVNQATFLGIVFQWETAKALEKARTHQPGAVDALFEHSTVLDLPTTLPTAWDVVDSFQPRFFAELHHAMAGYRPWANPPWQSQGNGAALLRPPMPPSFQPAFRPPPVDFHRVSPDHPPTHPPGMPRQHQAQVLSSRGRSRGSAARTKKAAARPGKRQRDQHKAAAAAAASATAAALAVPDAVGTSTAPLASAQPAPAVLAAPVQPVQPAPVISAAPAQPLQQVPPSATVALTGFTNEEQQILKNMLRSAQADQLRSDLSRSAATLKVAQRNLDALKTSNEASSAGAQ